VGIECFILLLKLLTRTELIELACTPKLLLVNHAITIAQLLQQEGERGEREWGGGVAGGERGLLKLSSSVERKESVNQRITNG